MRFFFVLLLTLFLFAFVPCPAGAAPTDFEIAALVNDEVITRHDLSNRMTIALHSTKLPDTAETRTKFMPQLLQMMVDETLERQEAKRLNISLTEGEKSRALGELEKQNGVKPGKLFDYIAHEGLDKESVMAQVRTQLLWTKVIYKKIRPQITVSDQELADAMTRAQNVITKGASEVELAEIVLPVASADEEKNVQQLATKLYEELRGGADFGSIAKEFSASGTSDKKGVIGWLPMEDLEGNIRQAIEGVDKGGLSLPTRTGRGYMIIKVMDKREGKAEKATPPDEAKVRESLVLRKMELEARRYLSNLRDQAYVEKRI
jgi:peptidyl-prolyl cis-trans isomerase SurA